MALVKIKDFDPRYSEILGHRNIIHYSVYSDLTDEKIGKVEDILVDEKDGDFRYLIIDIGFWIFGKKVLLPLDRAQFNFVEQRVYTKGLTKEQAEDLPEFDASLRVDNVYEEHLREIYRAHAFTSTTDLFGNPISPVVPFSPITMGTLASLTIPTAPPSMRTEYVRTDRDNRTSTDDHNK